MGAAQLLQSLETEPGFCAVVAESSFSSFREIAYDRVGQFFQTGPWLGRSILRPVVEAAFLYSQWKYGIRASQISPEDAVAKSQVPSPGLFTRGVAKSQKLEARSFPLTSTTPHPHLQ